MKESWEKNVGSMLEGRSLEVYLAQVSWKSTWRKILEVYLEKYVLNSYLEKYGPSIISGPIEVYMKCTWSVLGSGRIIYLKVSMGGRLSMLEVYFLSLSTHTWRTSSILEVYLKYAMCRKGGCVEYVKEIILSKFMPHWTMYAPTYMYRYTCTCADYEPALYVYLARSTKRMHSRTHLNA